MKEQGFIKRAALLACSNLVLQLMGFIYRMALTRYAGTQALGLNSLVMQVYSVVVSLCISGVSVAGTALAAGVRGGAAMRRLLQRCVRLYCALWFLSALPIFLLRHAIAANALSDPDAACTLALMLVCIFMTGLENVLKSLHMGAGLVGRCAASELCEQGVRFALVILMLVRLPHEGNAATVFYIMLGMTASELVSVGLLSASFASSIAKGEAKVTEIAEPRLKDIAQIALPASATAAASTVFASAAALLLPSRLAAYGLSSGEALSRIGILNSVALPVTMLPMAAVSAVSAVLMPEVARDVYGSRKLVMRTIATTAAIGAASAAVIIPAAPFITRALFGVDTTRALFASLSIKAAAIYPQVASTAVLNGAKKQRTVLVFAVCWELYQLVLMLLLTPVWGLYGYLAAMAAGETFRLVCNLEAVKRLYGSVPMRGLSACHAAGGMLLYTL